MLRRRDLTVRVLADQQTVTAENAQGATLWKTNMVEVCGMPYVGSPVVWHLRWRDDKTVVVIYGQHSWASIDMGTGVATFEGSD